MERRSFLTLALGFVAAAAATPVLASPILETAAAPAADPVVARDEAVDGQFGMRRAARRAARQERRAVRRERRAMRRERRMMRRGF